MIEDVLFAIWFFLPAGFANMVPVVAAKMPVIKNWNAPLDFGTTFRGKRIFGANKTWRGLGSAIIVAVPVLWLQQYLVRRTGWFDDIDNVNYVALPTLLLGALLALGALGGDAVKSFFKRQRGIKPGTVWFPYDLIDHIVGAALIAIPFVIFSWWIYLALIIIWLLLNIAISYGGYFLGIKERPV
jgi:CDP-2,3-bis-(O-geranylgeranyl)-sn-glycerol synthase